MTIDAHVRRYLTIAVIAFGASTAIVASNIQSYEANLQTAQGFSDTQIYLRMMHDEPPPYWAYRPVIPWLARRMPGAPYAFFNEQRRHDQDFMDAVKFGEVNWLLLIGTSILLYALCDELGLPFLAGLLAVVLLLTSTTVVREAGLPMTDIGFFFFLAMAALGIARRSLWLTAAAVALGVFTKELTLLALPMALLMPWPWRTRFLFSLPMLAIGAAYGMVMTHNAPTYQFAHNVLLLRHARSVLPGFAHLNSWINLFLAFGIGWLAAAYGATRHDAPLILRRWVWMVPLILVGDVVGLGALARGTFSAFPVVLPLAGLGLATFMND